MHLALTGALVILFVPVLFSGEISYEEHVITPDVSILDETPSYYTGRVITYPNRTVEIRGFEGERVVMQCNVFNMPRDARIVWRRDQLDGETMAEVINDGLMSRDMSRWKVGQGKQQDSIRLEIMSLDRTYEGLYTCECQYTGSVEPARVQRILRVFAKPSIIHHLSSYNTDSDVGDRVVLECAADGIPTPVIYWQRTGGPSSIIRNYGLTKNGNQIEFDPVQADDAGEYVCFAENSMGQALWRVQLQVRHPPIVRIYPFSPKQKVGCKIRLLCSVLANPPVVEPMIAWSTNHTGSLSVGSTRAKLQYLNAGMTRILVLDVDPVTSSDIDQTLTCSASNTLGAATSSVTLTESDSEVLLLNGRLACGTGSTQHISRWLRWLSKFLLACITVQFLVHS